jgi:Flp pilus assembly protein TadB
MSDPHPPQPSFAEMLGDVIDLMGGLATVLLPLWIIAIPGVVLILVLPVVLLLLVAAVPALVVGAVVTPPFLVVRAVRRKRSAREQARVDHERGARHVARAV